jgi:hypothetical protein
MEDIQMAAEKGYNGWTNYETWLVALWIDNEQGTYGMRQELAQDAWDQAEFKRGYLDDVDKEAETIEQD